MAQREIEAKSILRKQKRIDSWFLGRYGMNLYRGCTHGCVYCDGRAERYRVEGDFERDINVKTNAPEILARELDPERKRKPMAPGVMFVGGGVSDSYQPAERSHGLTRRVLQLLLEQSWPVHMLTKSTLVERDTDVLLEIDSRSRAIVSFSFSTVDDAVGKALEPGVPSPSDRLALIERLAARGITCGVYLLPLVPHVTDDEESVRRAFAAFHDAGVRFVATGGMTLKEGCQKEHFLRAVWFNWPDQIPALEATYPAEPPRPYGEPAVDREQQLAPLLLELSAAHGLPLRMPVDLVAEQLTSRDRAVAILDQTDYLLRLRGVRSPFGRAANRLAIAAIPGVAPGDVPTTVDQLTTIPGIGRETARMILEIGTSGTSRRYAELLYRASR